MRKNNHRSIPTTEVKSRVKMWRSGKNWVYGLLFFFGMAGISLGQAHQVHADTTTLDSETQKGTIAEQLTAQKVVLQSSVTPATADSTNTATSDSDTGSATDVSDTAKASDPSAISTTDTPATTTLGDNNASATTESPASDPASSTTTEKTDLTGATKTADSSTAAISDAPESSETTATTETPATEASTTDAAATSEGTTTTDASQTAVDETDTAASNEKVDAPSTVDTTNTPLPEVNYKSMLSAAQASALAGSATTSSANDNLPEGFTVNDPDYPDGSFYEPQDSGLYSFFQASTKTDNLVLSVNRNDVNEIHAQILTADSQSIATDQVITEGKNSIGNWTVINDGGDISSLYVEHTGDNFFINYDVDAYPQGSYENGEQKTWVGWAALKPMSQTQTTYYIDKDGNSIADPVSMTGLSGQSYTTNASSELIGYNATGSDNATGTMSPFMTDGQIFREELYSGATDIGTLVYTLKDADTGQMTITLKAKSAAFTFMDYSVTKTLNRGDSYKTRGAITYTVKNIYLPQTTSVTYTYDASQVNVPVVFKDQNGLVFDPGDSVSSTIQMAFKANTPVSAPDITGYTYDGAYASTATDNPTDYTVTDFANPGTITWHYTANPEKVIVHHVDGSGTQIASDTTIDGVYAQNLSLNATTDSNYDITDYQPRSDAPTSYTFNENTDQSITITYDQTATVPLNYVVDNANNTTTPLDVSALDVPTTLTGVVGTSVDVTTPTIAGYSAVTGNPTAYTIKQNDKDGVTLHYTANVVNVEVHFEDAKTHVEVGTPVKATTTTGAKIQVKVAGPNLYVADGYTFSKDPVINGTLDLAADGSVLIDVVAPAVDGTTPYIVTVPLDLTQYVDAPTTPGTTTDSKTKYKMTHRTFTVKTNTTAGSQFAATNGNQTIAYTRQYLIDSYGNPSTIIGYGNWVCQTAPLADVTSQNPDGYSKAITLTLNGTPTTMADDTAVNASLQDALGTLMNLPKDVNVANTADATIDISYTATDHKLTVHFVDSDTQNEISTAQIFDGTTNGAIDFTKDESNKALNKVITGYLMVDDGTKDLTTFAATDPQDATITYKKINGGYTYTTPTSTDSTTVTWPNDSTDPTKITDGTVLAIADYTAYVEEPDGSLTALDKTPDNNNYIVPAPADPTNSTTVIYKEDNHTLTVRYVDVTNSPDATLPPVQKFSGLVGTKIDFNHDTNNKALTRYQPGYLLIWDGTDGVVTYTDAEKSVSILYTPITGDYLITPVDGGEAQKVPFQSDPQSPSQFATQTVPAVAGYTPVVVNGDGTKTPLTAGTDGYTLPTPENGTDIEIKYVAASQKLTVHYQFSGGDKKVDDVVLTGDSDSTVDYTVLEKSFDGYVFDEKASTLTSPFDKDSDADQTATLVYNATSDYTYTTPGTDQSTTTQYKTDGKVPTLVTGTIPYAEGYIPTSDNGTVTPIDSDDLTKGYTLMPEFPTHSATITYEARDTSMHVKFVDEKDGKVAEPVTIQGKTGDPIDYSHISKTVDGHILKTDGTTAVTNFSGNADQTATLVYTASGKYTVTTPDNNTTPEVSYTNDPADPYKATGTVPYVEGYTPISTNGTDFTPVKDTDGKITGYTFTPKDPTAPATITYEAQDASMQVKFVNGDGGKEVADSQIIDGKTGDPIDYSHITKLVDGYILTTDGTTEVTYFSGAAGQTAILTYTVSGNYTYTTPGTDLITTTQYTTDPDDPSAATGTIPYVEGYTPTSDNGTVTPIDPDDLTKGYTLTPEFPTHSATITYGAQDTNMQVKFVDGDGANVAEPVEISGKTGDPIDYSHITKSVAGHILMNDGTTEVTNFSGNAGQTATLTYTISGDYTYTTPGTDQSTTTQYTTDPDDPSAATGTIPYVEGYTPISTNGTDFTPVKDTDGKITGYTFTPDDPTTSATITYEAQDTSMQVKFVDEEDGKVAEPVKIQGKTGDPIDYSHITKLVAGYILKTDGTTEVTNFSGNADQTATLVYTASGKYTVTTPDNNTTPEVSYTTDPKNPAKVTATVPYVEGYTPTTFDNGTDFTPVTDADGKVTGYTFTPTYPTRQATITYTAGDITVKVAFVDESNAEIEGHDSQTFTAQTDTPTSYTTINKLIDGYVLLDDGTTGHDKFTAADNNQTLKITYNKTSGGYNITQPGDDEPTNTPYVTDPDDPSKVNTINVPSIPGYTPDVENGTLTPTDKGYTVTPDDPSKATKVTYTAGKVTVNVAFVDDKDNEIEGHDAQTLSGETDTPTSYTSINKLIDGYVLVDDGTTGHDKFTAADDGKTLNITYKQTDGGYNITQPGDDEPTNTPYVTDPDDPSKVNTINVPSIPGYTPNVENGTLTPTDKGYTVTPDDPSKATKVTYTAGKVTVKVAFVDEKGNEISGHDVQTLNGTTDTPTSYTSINKLIDGYVLVTDGTTGHDKFTAADDGKTLNITYKQTDGGYNITQPGDDEPTNTPYATNPEDPSKVNTINVPSIPGYTPNVENGKLTPTDKGYTVTPDDPSKATKVTYTADEGKFVNVAYVDENNKEIAGHPVTEFSGATDETIDYGTKVIAGYVLTADETKDKTTFAATDAGTLLTIHYQKVDVTVTTPTGEDTTVDFPADPDDPTTVQPGHVGYIKGYTPTDGNDIPLPQVDDHDKTKGYTVPVPADATTPTTITYAPDVQIVEVHLIDTEGNAVKNDKGESVITVKGRTGEGIQNWEIDKSAAAYMILDDGTAKPFTFDDDDNVIQEVDITYLKLTQTKDPDGGTTSLLTDGNGVIVAIDRDWPDGDHTHVDFNVNTDVAIMTETPDDKPDETPVDVQPGDSTTVGKTTLDNGKPDGDVILTHAGTDGDTTTETITPKGERIFTYTHTTNDPDGGTTTTTTDVDGHITTINRDWPDGDHSHVDIDTGTGVATITETPKGGAPTTPVEVQPGDKVTDGKTTLDNGAPEGNVLLTHPGTDSDTTETITPDGTRAFTYKKTQSDGGISVSPKDFFTTTTTHDPDGGTTATKTNGDGDITMIDRDWPDGDHSHVDINTDTGVATITEKPAGGDTTTPVEVQPGDKVTDGKTTLDNGEPDGNVVLTHTGTDGDTNAAITPDGKRIFTYTQTTNDPDGGKTTTTTDVDGHITTIDRDWPDGDHSHVDIDTGTGIATITETPAGKPAGIPVEVQPGEKGTDGKTTLDNGEPDGNVVLTHQGTDGDTTTEAITPEGERIFTYTQITHDPDGGTTTTKTNGDGDITTIDKDWSDGDHSHVDIDTDTGIATITETPKGENPTTPIEVKPGGKGTDGKTTLDNGEPDGNVVLTHQGNDGDTTAETITPDGTRNFAFKTTRSDGGISVSPKDFYNTTTTNDPDGGKTMTKTNGDGDITAIDRDWPDGDHSHVDIDIDTGVATITETPKGKHPTTPVEVQPGGKGTDGKTTLDNGAPDGNVVLTHQTTDGDITETITPDAQRSFKKTQSHGGISVDPKDFYNTTTTNDPDGGTTTTKTNGDGDILTIDKYWSDGDHSHVDIDTGTGVATITETPKGGAPTTPIEVQPGEKGTDGKTTLDNGEPDGNVVLTHQGNDGDTTTETITPDGTRTFAFKKTQSDGGISVDPKDFYNTTTTHDPDGGTTATKTNGDGDILTIDKYWSDGDHSHVDIDTGTGVATITETPAGGTAGTPVNVQPGKKGTDGKTTLDNGEPDGNVVLTHQGNDGDTTTETITPDGTRTFAFKKTQSDGGISVSPKDFYNTTTTNDPDGGTTTTKTNGDGDILTIDKDWSDGDHSHVDIDIDTGVATITETPAGGTAGTPIEVQPGDKGTDGKTTLDNGEPDGNIILTHQGNDGDTTTETITPDGTRTFAFTKTRSEGDLSVSPKDFFTTTTTNDPDGGTTTKTNGDGDILTIDKDWSDGDHSHVDINTDTGVATITETPKGGAPTTPIEVQPGDKGTDGKTTLDNGEPDGNIILTHQGTDGDTTTETITPDGTRTFTFKKTRSDGGISIDPKDFYDTRTTDDPNGGTTTVKTNGNGDVTTIDKDWGDGGHTHVDIDPNTGDATITDTDQNGHTTTPITVKPGDTATTGTTTIKNNEPGDVVLTHTGTNGGEMTTITPNGEVTTVLLPDTNGDEATDDGAANTTTSTTLPQTSARTDVPGKKSESLPQTGDKQSPLGLLGAILLGSFALLGKRRRHDDD